MKKDLARFSSAGNFVPGSTDGQWKRFKRQLQLATEHNPVFDHPRQQQHFNHRPELIGDNSFYFRSEQQRCI